MNNGGKDLKKGYFSTHWSIDVKSEISQSFVKRYLQQSDTKEITYEALSYDTVMLLADAIRRANSLDRSKIREALAQTKSFNGVTGIPDWRWLLDRSDSPWYPSVRLIRQQQRGDWDGVFKNIYKLLCSL